MKQVESLSGSKSQLGKLLASENIRIEHRQVRGPYFDVQTRTLVLPIWKDVDSDLYDLMIGHEVGHALFTPSEGWIEKVKALGQGYKAYLNLLEDVRIEKKMKRKYPGLRKPMYNGYTTLLERDFFGVPLDEMKYLPFADRLNVYCKLGPRANVCFSADEQAFLDRVESAETFPEIVILADELHGLAKEEKHLFEDIFLGFENEDGTGADADEAMTPSKGMSDFLKDMVADRGGSKQDSGDDESLPGEEDDAGTPSSQGKESGSPSTNKQPKSAGSSTPTPKDRGAETPKVSEKLIKKLREWSEQDEEEQSSITGEAMKEQEQTLIDPRGLDSIYVKMPKLRIKDWVIPAKVVHEVMGFGVSTSREKLFADFMSSNRNYIAYLVKEFELRRNAKQFAKAKVSKTGKLDMSKIYKYRLSDDLFLQSTIVPNGKNHGMMMMVDLSGSMGNNIAGTLEQIISLSMFCRKVNIPFDVYGFNDNSWCSEEFEKAGIDCTETMSTYYGNVRQANRATRNDYRASALTINSGTFRLQQLLHYKMSLTEYNTSVKNLLQVADSYNARRSYYNNCSVAVPNNMMLGGTPLDEAILVLTAVAQKFREDTKVEILNTIILTDGDATGHLGLNDKDGSQTYISGPGQLVITDEATRTQVTAPSSFGTFFTNALLEMYREVTKSRLVGYYLMSGHQTSHKSAVYSRYRQYTEQQENYEVFEKQYANEYLKYKFFGIVDSKAYDVYYMLPGSNLEIEDVTMDDVLAKKKQLGSSDKRTLLSAFKKMRNTKTVSRVFLNQFIRYVS